MTEQQRKENFISETNQSADTFDYHKNIFQTWSLDVIQNYDLFCAHGLLPMQTSDLQNFKVALENMLTQINNELNNR